jgi:hypothetical protein
MLAAISGSSIDLFWKQALKVPDKKREEILRLIAEGKNVDPPDLENFY